MSFRVQAYMCVLSYKYKESTHFDFCLVKRVQRITVLRYTSVTPLITLRVCYIESSGKDNVKSLMKPQSTFSTHLAYLFTIRSSLLVSEIIQDLKI